MPVEQALRQLQEELAGDVVPNVVLASRPFGGEQDDFRRLNISPEVQQSFLEIARDNVQGEWRLVPYEPGYKPDTHELCWIDLQAGPGVAETVTRISAFQNLVLFQNEDAAFLDYLQFYALFVRVSAHRSVILLRKSSPKLELTRGHKVAVLMRAGQYDRFEETMFLFDRNVDCWTDGRYMYIANIANFEKIFRYFEELQRRAVATVNTVLRRVPIANVEEFRRACTTQVRFMTKLAMIAGKPYLRHIGMADIRRAIRDHRLPVESVREDGIEKLVFDPDPSRRWILLKLLDDDYLNSVMTRLKYEVNSKIAQE